MPEYANISIKQGPTKQRPVDTSQAPSERGHFWQPKPVVNFPH